MTALLMPVQVLDKMDFNDSIVQHVVLASIPAQESSAAPTEVSCARSLTLTSQMYFPLAARVWVSPAVIRGVNVTCKPLWHSCDMFRCNSSWRQHVYGI